MPFTSIEQFSKSFPATKALTSEQQKKAFGVFKALLRDTPNMPEGRAIAVAIKQAKGKEELSEVFHYASTIELKDNATSEVEVLRAGIIQDRGLKISSEMLADFVKNFDDDVYGQGKDVPVNLSHDREGEAAGWVRKLVKRGDKLFAFVEWTELGLEKINKKLFKFVSAELAQRLKHHKDGRPVKNVFIGLALTNIPALKGQAPIVLSEELNQLLINNTMLKTLLAAYKKRKAVSKEDKDLMRTMLEELPAEEKAEVKEDVAEVEAKPEEAKEEAPEEEKKEEEKPADAPKEEAPKEEAAKDESTAELSEKVTNLAEENRTLREKVETKELNELVAKKLILSEDNGVSIGFVGEAKDKIVKFMMALTESQRDEFTELLSEIKSVNLSEIGSSRAKKRVSLSQGSVVELAETKMAEAKTNGVVLSMREAQDQALKELNK